MIKYKAAWAALSLAAACFTPAHAATLSGEVSLTGAEPTMTPRFFRAGEPTTGANCSTFSSGDFQYLTVPFKTNASGSLKATVDPLTCGTNAFVTFHTAPFDPAAICTNHVFNHGSSQAFDETFTVPANTDMLMVVSGVFNAPNTVCGPVTYTLDGTKSTNTLPENLAAASKLLTALLPAEVSGPGQRNLLLALVRNVASYGTDPKYRALSISNINSAIARTNGCKLRGTPDTMAQGGLEFDYILTCEKQAPILTLLEDIREQLTELP